MNRLFNVAQASFLAMLVAFMAVTGCGRSGKTDDSAKPETSCLQDANTNRLSETRAAPSPSVKDRTDGVIVLNLATANRIEPPFVVVEDSSAVNGQAVSVPTGAETNMAGSVEISFDIRETGVYSVWVRTHWKDACSNSIRLGIDDLPPIRVIDNTFGIWHWVPVRFGRGGQGVSLEAGTHRLRLWKREDGVKIDQALFAPWHEDEFLRYIPQAIE